MAKIRKDGGGNVQPFQKGVLPSALLKKAMDLRSNSDPVVVPQVAQIRWWPSINHEFIDIWVAHLKNYYCEGGSDWVTTPNCWSLLQLLCALRVFLQNIPTGNRS